MSSLAETLGMAMQAVGAAVAAVQVLLFGVSERAHLARETPGDRLAIWLTHHTTSREAFVAAAGTLRTSPARAARVTYWVGSYALGLVAIGIIFGTFIATLGYLGPRVLTTDETNGLVVPIEIVSPLVDLVLSLVIVLTLVAASVGSGFVAAIALLTFVAPWLGRRLLPVLHWLGRNLEVTLRWAVLLFGLGAVIEFANRL